MGVAVFIVEAKQMSANKQEQKRRLIKAFARYLTHDLAKQSIYLEMGMESAKVWKECFTAAGCRGWITEAEAEKVLSDLLL